MLDVSSDTVVSSGTVVTSSTVVCSGTVVSSGTVVVTAGDDSVARSVGSVVVDAVNVVEVIDTEVNSIDVVDPMIVDSVALFPSSTQYFCSYK